MSTKHCPNCSRIQDAAVITCDCGKDLSHAPVEKSFDFTPIWRAVRWCVLIIAQGLSLLGIVASLYMIVIASDHDHWLMAWLYLLSALYSLAMAYVFHFVRHQTK